jgi:hypothetical protein
MTLTVEFTAPFHWLPWIIHCWNNLKKDGNNDKFVGFGWGPLQIYLTNFSPIAAGNRWHRICSAIVKDDNKMFKIEGIATSDEFPPETVDRLVDTIMLDRG